MTDTPVSPPARSDVIVVRAPWRRWSRRRWRRTVQIALLPLIAVGTGMPILIFAVLGFRSPPPWITDVRAYQIAGRLAVALTLLGSAQVAMTWIIGLLAARGGTLAARGQGALIRRRLRIVRRRFTVAVMGIILLRLAMVAVIALMGVYTYTRVLGPTITTLLPPPTRMRPLLELTALTALTIAGLHWIIGPVLRLRYSSALGALAAAYASGSEERIAAAVGARLGAGFAGALGILWSGTLVLLALLTISDPSSYTGPPRSVNPYALPLFWLGVIALVLIMAVGQIVLAWVFLRIAKRRLSRRPARRVEINAAEVSDTVG